MPKLKVYKGGPGSGHYGHAGRPGKRGGSVGGSVAMSIRTGKDAAERQAAASRAGKQTGPKPGTPGQPGPEHIERYVNAKVYVDENMQEHIMGSKDDLSTYAGAAGAGDDKQEFFIADENSASSAGNVIRGNVKAQLVDDVYNKIPMDQRYDAQTNPEGISKDDVNQMVKQWARESNDHAPDSLSMQQAASKEFGVALSDYQKNNINEILTKDEWAGYRSGDALKSVNSLSETNQRAVLRAMYDNTQSQLSQMGYKPGDTVTVFRGVKINSDQGVPKQLPQGTLNYQDNAMASWSTQWNVAKNFTAFPISGRNVLSQQVPIENILSTCRTGFGCLNEAEIVVLASPGTQVTVTDVGR